MLVVLVVLVVLQERAKFKEQRAKSFYDTFTRLVVLLVLSS